MLVAVSSSHIFISFVYLIHHRIFKVQISSNSLVS